MNMKFYYNLNRKVRADKTKRQLVMILNELLTWLIVLIYVICLILLLVRRQYRELFLLAGVPLAGFILSRFLRMIVRDPRPYQRIRIKPLVRRRKSSYSFPSCHITSAFVIGTSLCAVSMVPAGVLVLILGIGLAFLRVMAGAHYIKDVLAGAALGILCGLVAYLIR